MAANSKAQSFSHLQTPHQTRGPSASSESVVRDACGARMGGFAGCARYSGSPSPRCARTATGVPCPRNARPAGVRAWLAEPRSRRTQPGRACGRAYGDVRCCRNAPSARAVADAERAACCRPHASKQDRECQREERLPAIGSVSGTDIPCGSEKGPEQSGGAPEIR